MITLKLGDITKENVDAIVNAANSGLRGGGGVDGAIHLAAGASVMEECRKIGGCETGKAVATTGGRLLARMIFHAVGPIWEGGDKNEAQLLSSCYRTCFELALSNELKTIAFPAISTGVYGYPKDAACCIALGIGNEYKDRLQEIRYVCFSEEDLNIYQRTWKELGSAS